MARAYRIAKPDEAVSDFRYLVSGARPAIVPPILCLTCGGNRPWGFCYPAVDITGLTPEILRNLHLEDSGELNGIPLETYRDLEARLAPILGPGRPLSPLTDLGPSRGNAEGRFGDFAWGDPDQPLVRQSVFEALQAAGFVLNAVPHALAYRRQRRDPLVELEVLPTAHAHPSKIARPCTTCGFEKWRHTETVTLDAESFDDGLPLQRVFERPNILLVNEALGEFIQERQLTEVALIPLAFK